LRGVVIDDLDDFKMIAQPKLSPDTGKILYLVMSPNGEKYRNSLMVVDRETGEVIWSVEEGPPSNPDWGPHGDQIVYTSSENKDETNIWVAKVGEKPRLVAKLKHGVTKLRWSSDGEALFFIAGVGETDPDVRLIDRIPLWYNGEGWVYHKTKHLHRLHIDTGILSRLSQGDLNVQCYAISNTGTRIAYCQSASQIRPAESNLFIFDVNTGERNMILSGYMVQSLVWSPDDKTIAFMGSDGSRGYATHVGVHLISVDGGLVRCLTEKLDRCCSRRHYHDTRSMYSDSPGLVWDGDHIYFPLSDSDRYELHTVDPVSGEISPVLKGQYCIEEFTARKGIVAYTRLNTDRPPDLWVYDGCERQLTRLNKDVLDRLKLQTAERFSFTQEDGAEVEGWVLKPVGWRPDMKYPAILDIHGGPKSKFGDSFMFEHQLYASNGYGVIYLNIRGSSGYSQEFGDTRGKWGVWDYEDLKAGVRRALELHPWIDEKRLGVTGLSYGGYMTNWVITHSDMFKTAISQNGICSWTSFFGTSDIGFHFTPEQIGGTPWSNLEKYLEKSPITYVKNVDTPILFIHSWEDYRCWVDQSIEFFTALKYLGKETKLVMFMEGPHTFRSVARMSLRKRRYQLMLEWFDKYLKA